MEEPNKWIVLFQDNWHIFLIILVVAGIMFTITEILERKRKKAEKEKSS